MSDTIPTTHPTKVPETNISGTKPSGVTKKVATRLGSRIKTAFSKEGKRVRIKGMRFIPSSKIDLGQGSFQVMANTIVEVAGIGGRPARVQAFDSVVTVTRQAGEGQMLESATIPPLDRVSLEHA